VQSDFIAVELAKQMQKLGLDPAGMENAAGRAKSVGRPNAVSDLADLVESLDAPVSRLPVGKPQRKEAFA
jgi:UDP-N-acetylglucosamine--N-acetylmuramyl-(pentapeptide) pyrophosphoryl-undecaprenol N-acetylglucosamine transferase